MRLERIRKWMMHATIIAATGTLGTVLNVQCSAAWKIFRGEASQNIGEGVKTILEGVIDGIVAVADPTDAQSQSAASGG